MKVLVFGAGAVGGYIGAHLVENGLDVTFVARGIHLQNMIDKGLKIILGSEEKTILETVFSCIHFKTFINDKSCHI